MFARAKGGGKMADKHDIPDDFWDLSSLLPKKRPPVMRERKPDVDTVTIELSVPEKKDTREHDIGSLSVRFREVDKPSRASVDVTVHIKSGGMHPVTSGALNVPSPTVETVNIDFGKSESEGNDSLRLPPRQSVKSSITAELIDEYEPKDGLLRRVRVMRWPSKYSFYEQFRHDARRYADVKGSECPAVDFFSYTPQYRQMSKAQLAYYFWWRTNAIRGEWLPASFSYILLYIYEIINLHETIPPPEGLRRLISAWLAYRDKHRVLDKYLSEWVADYCLIHRLPAPRAELEPIMTAVMESASFREFYMAGGSGGVTIETLIDLSSDYNWHKSKFAIESEAVAAQYRRHIPGAIGYVAEMSRDGRFSTSGMTSAVVSRDAFCGSLCAHNVKCRIDIEYLSYTRSRELRALMTELVKYCENRLRAALGIRSRLRVGELDGALRVLADEYFDREFPQSKKPPKMSAEEKLAAEERQYDAAYDALTHGVDAIGAAAIERASWASTELLTPDTDDAAERDTADRQQNAFPAPIAAAENNGAPASGTPEPNGSSIFAGLDAAAAEYLKIILDQSAEDARVFCRARSLYEDELAARINEISSDVVGDIILEPDEDGGYRIVEDYRDEIR